MILKHQIAPNSSINSLTNHTIKHKTTTPHAHVQISHARVISVDAGCFSDGYTASACVFKDYTDVTTFSACKKEQTTADPKTSEALGIRWCMQLAKDQRIKEIIVQTNALAVVECIRGSNSIASIEHIVADCKTLMNAFSKVSVNYISRELNVLAHRLVGYAMQVGNKTWLGYPLPLNDVMVSCIASVI